MYSVFRSKKMTREQAEQLKQDVKDIFDGVIEAIDEGRMVEMFENVVSQKRKGFFRNQILERYEMKICIDLPPRTKRVR